MRRKAARARTLALALALASAALALAVPEGASAQPGLKRRGKGAAAAPTRRLICTVVGVGPALRSRPLRPDAAQAPPLVSPRWLPLRCRDSSGTEHALAVHARPGHVDELRQLAPGQRVALDLPEAPAGPARAAPGTPATATGATALLRSVSGTARSPSRSRDDKPTALHRALDDERATVGQVVPCTVKKAAVGVGADSDPWPARAGLKGASPRCLQLLCDGQVPVRAWFAAEDVAAVRQVDAGVVLRLRVLGVYDPDDGSVGRDAGAGLAARFVEFVGERRGELDFADRLVLGVEFSPGEALTCGLSRIRPPRLLDASLREATALTPDGSDPLWQPVSCWLGDDSVLLFPPGRSEESARFGYYSKLHLTWLGVVAPGRPVLLYRGVETSTATLELPTDYSPFSDPKRWLGRTFRCEQARPADADAPPSPDGRVRLLCGAMNGTTHLHRFAVSDLGGGPLARGALDLVLERQVGDELLARPATAPVAAPR